MKNNNAIIYYNDNGLNIYYNNKCYLFSNILSNFILNFSNQIFASSMNNIYLPKKIFKLDANILNIDTITLKFPFERGFIYQDFSLYEYPKYYSPTFDYENTESRYYLGVYSIANKTINNLNFTIPKGDDIFQQSIECSDGTYRNSILFVADMQGNILWTWDLYEYLKNNNLSLLEHPIIQTASRLGKNYLNLNENDIVISISKRNQILIINPLNNNIDLKIDTSWFNRTITSFCDAHIIPFGLPGGGQNLLFYNHNRNNKNLTEILEYDIINKRVIFEYSSDLLNSNRSIVGSVQKLENGNYLIYNYEKSNLFEITNQKEYVFIYKIKDETADLSSKELRQTRGTHCSRAQQVPFHWVNQLIKNHDLINNLKGKNNNEFM